jgi:hypothetical protein
VSRKANNDDAEKPTEALVEEYSQIAIFAEKPEVAACIAEIIEELERRIAIEQLRPKRNHKSR